MDRRYQRKYEKYDAVIPRPEDFPVLNADNKVSEFNNYNNVKSDSESLKTDDLLLLGIIILLLMEEEKDVTAILSVAALLLAGYIF